MATHAGKIRPEIQMLGFAPRCNSENNGKGHTLLRTLAGRHARKVKAETASAERSVSCQ